MGQHPWRELPFARLPAWLEARSPSFATGLRNCCTLPARSLDPQVCGSTIVEPMRILFALPGLHRFGRGAEVVFESVAEQIALRGEHQVTLVGSGEARTDRAYDFIHLPAASRERFEHWPKLPFLRHEFMYEELSFA